MPLLQQHVAHVVVARVDDKPLDSPDLAVGGIDALTAAHADLARGQGAVRTDRLIFSGLGPILAHAPAVVRQHEHLFRAVARVLVQAGPRREMLILGEAEFVELRPSAAQPDLVRCRGIDKVEKDKLAQAGPVLRLDHQMGNRPATGSTTTRTTLPQTPSTHLAPAPITNGVSAIADLLIRLEHSANPVSGSAVEPLGPAKTGPAPRWHWEYS